MGRRLAFNGERGRLWVVCSRCLRWNLTPLEERWEAIECCERLFRETPLRASTDQVGMAKHREGLELVRIGAPERPEFAAWRYGPVFARRHRLKVALGLGGIIATTGLVAAQHLLTSLLAPLGYIAFNAGTVAWDLWWRKARTFTRLELPDGSSVPLKARDAGKARLVPSEVEGNLPHLLIEHSSGPVRVEGVAAERALGRLLAVVNQDGAKPPAVAQSVDRLVSGGGPAAFLRERAQVYARREGGRRRETPFGGLADPSALVVWDRADLLAAEMALHEDTERRALEGELAALEDAWREAEEIAAIADTMLLPSSVLDRFSRLRGA